MTERRFPPSPTYDEVHGTTPPAGEYRSNGAATKPAKANKAALGRFAELNYFSDVTGRSCNAAGQGVWLRMFRHARNGECRVSKARIADETGFSLPTVKRAVRGLIAKGFVTLKARGNSGGRTNVYEVRATPKT